MSISFPPHAQFGVGIRLRSQAPACTPASQAESDWPLGPSWAGHMPRAGSLVLPLLREMESSLTSTSCTFLASRASGVSANWDPGSPLKPGHLYSVWGPAKAHPALPLSTVPGGKLSPSHGLS